MYLKSKTLKSFRPDIIFKKLYKIANACKEYYSPLTIKYYTFLISCLRLYVKGKFHPSQVFQLGFGSFFPSNGKINKYIGMHKMLEIINTLDPKPWRPIQDKGVFYTFCTSLKLPIPKLYAIIFSNHTGVSYKNYSLINNHDLIQFIRNELPNEFVIKPSNGLRGKFLNIYTKTNNGILDAFGDLKTEQEIYEGMKYHNRFDSFIVQERLRNHPDLLKVQPSEFLHTIRVITFINSTGQFSILHTHLDLATGLNIASQKGNLRIKIASDDGTLEYGILLDKKDGGFKKVFKHPETGIDLKEFKLPFWSDLLSLSKEAAIKFLPLRTLGWDFAITDKGVKIIETNVGYAAPNIFGDIDKIVKTLLDD